MTVLFHPEFAEDINRFAGQYREASERLAARFQTEVDAAIARIQFNPTGAGHTVDTGSTTVRDL